METAKKITTISVVIVFLFSNGILSGYADIPTGSKSGPEGSKSVQTQTKPTQTTTKSAQTKTKSTQTATKSVQTKPKTSQKSSKAEPVKKVKEPGTLIIGSQTWAEANLNVTTFRNGDTIPEARTNKEWVAAGESGKPAWCYYNNDPAIGKKYGRLYNWFAVNDPRGLAPTGWALPGDEDWAKLGSILGGPGTAGSKLKSTGGWNEGSVGTNDSGFAGFPGGYRIENGIFQNIGSIGIWWSTTENNPLSAIDHYLAQNNSLARSSSPKQRGESVRCIKK
jgi:uncharacterized protein (TIGR02145 family)